MTGFADTDGAIAPPWSVVDRQKAMALQAYIDDSRSGGKFVLAGYVAPAEIWAAFSNEWRELLGMRPSLEYFKMSEMAGSSERLERSSWFYRVIERHVTAAVSCVIDMPGLVKAVREFNWPPNFVNLHELENPYYFAFKAIIDGFAQYQERLGLDLPIDFIFDDQTEKAVILQGWMDAMKLASEPKFRRFMGKTPLYRDDKLDLPLQAADLYAWWVRKWESDGIDDGVEKLKFAWDSRREIPRLHMQFSEDDFKKEFEKANDPNVQIRMHLLNPGEVLRSHSGLDWSSMDMLKSPFIAPPYRARLRVAFSFMK